MASDTGRDDVTQSKDTGNSQVQGIIPLACEMLMRLKQCVLHCVAGWQAQVFLCRHTAEIRLLQAALSQATYAPVDITPCHSFRGPKIY